ncbi:MAG: hypothetical protein KAQ96_14265, partial [Thermoplasmata archaeon]|nr:hypothetical protein [Thermoplasmata archaeon]
GRILLQDDNFQPIPNGNVSVYYKEEGVGARKNLIKKGTTDSQGFFEFNWTFQVNTIGNMTYIVEYEGLTMDTFLKQGDHIILPLETLYNITYIVPPPGNITDLVARADNGRIVLTWTAPAAVGKAPATGYKVYRGTSENDSALLAELGNVLSYTDKDVETGTTYYYSVLATSDFGDSELSGESNATAKEADDGPWFYVGVALVAICAISIMVWRRRMQ